MPIESWTIVEARSQEDLASVRALIERNNHIRDSDPRFQGFLEEMRTFPAAYELVLMAKSSDGSAIGCVCLKRLEAQVCEMKRMFVIPDARRRGAGRALSVRLIEEAKRRGFTEIKLDTLERLKPALALFRNLGFVEAAPYAPNPEPDVVYMSKLL